MLDTLDSLLFLCPLEPVNISPYTMPGAALPRTPKSRDVMAKRERGNRKDRASGSRTVKAKGEAAEHRNSVKDVSRQFHNTWKRLRCLILTMLKQLLAE